MTDQPRKPMSDLRGLRSGDLTLFLIENSNLKWLESQISSFDERDYFLQELHRSYLPRFDNDGLRTKYGFYAMLGAEMAGMSLLGINSWQHRRGYTGADTFPHMRGRGVAPKSKPLLFYLAFGLLHLHRVETGCLRSNLASRRSIEKTPGFEFEGVLRDYNRINDNHYEDDLRWAILKPHWLRLYDTSEIEVIP